MFDYIYGNITDRRKSQKGTFLTVEVCGIGYLAEITENDFVRLDGINADKTKVYLHLQHREDSMSLYGFLNKETRDIFQILLSVTGVGAKMALSLLNEFDACELISLVINGDFKELTRAKGVGPKLAQKIILELQDKLIKTSLPDSPKSVSLCKTQSVTDAEAVLISLGYEEKEIEDTFKKIIATITENTSSEEILRKALTTLST